MKKVLSIIVVSVVIYCAISAWVGAPEDDIEGTTPPKEWCEAKAYIVKEEKGEQPNSCWYKCSCSAGGFDACICPPCK